MTTSPSCAFHRAAPPAALLCAPAERIANEHGAWRGADVRLCHVAAPSCQRSAERDATSPWRCAEELGQRQRRLLLLLLRTCYSTSEPISRASVPQNATKNR